MSNHAQFRDGVYSLRVGTKLGVTPIVYGTAQNVKCFVRNVEFKSPTETSKVNTGCGPQLNVTLDLQELTFEVLIPRVAVTNPLQAVGSDLRLSWLEFSYEPESQFSAPYVFAGVVTDYVSSGDADQNYWIERMTLSQVALA